MWIDILGNLGNALYLVGSGFKKILYLRIVLVLAGIIELVYFILIGIDDLVISIVWGSLFIIINLYMIGLYLFELKATSLNADEARLFMMVFPYMEKVVFKKLLKIGNWVSFEPGVVLVKEKQDTEKLQLLFEGKAQVDADGRTITILNPGSFIGEISFLTEGKATATVISMTDIRLFEWDKQSLIKLMKNNPDIEREMTRVFSGDLVKKLVKFNQ